MKKLVFISMLIFLCFGFYGFLSMERTIGSILKQLELTDSEAKEHVWSNIWYANFYFPSPKELKKAPQAERSEIIKAVAEYVKAYTRTDEFKAKFKEEMASRKPEAPAKPESMDETRKKQKEEIKKSISEMEANKKKMPSDQQKIFESTITMLKEQLKEIDNPENPLYNNKEADNYIQQGYEEEMKAYKEKLAKWEKENNGSPNILVKEWLSKFLEETKDINFNAALREEYGKKKFVEQQYEDKSHIWKLCFRAGKQATETARLFAQNWLNELK